jgi:PAS domain S-box-containing protein
MVQIEVDDITVHAQQREVEAERDGLAKAREELEDRVRLAGVTVRELRAANDTMAAELGRLRADNEQLQLAHEEVQAGAEEIETLNEEQQAANEELETLNEELQATIKELNTANSELEARAIQLESLASTLEARRLESEEWFQAIIEEASDYAIFTTDANNQIESWTPGAVSIFGWSAEVAVGEQFDILFTPDDRRAGIPGKEIETARETGQASDTRWHLRQDGSRVFIEGSSRARRDPDGGFQGLLKIGRDITERQLTEQRRLEVEEQVRQQLEQRVAESTAELRALSRRLLQVHEEERRHLARELHDEIGQMLTGLQFQLASVPADGAGLEEAQQTVRDLTEQVRQLSMDLRPAALDGYGLAAALEWHVDRFRHRIGVAVELRHEGVNRRFSPEVEVTAYRVVQEALTNLARHSGAGTATVQLLADDQTLTVSIRDDGNGFDPAMTTNGSGLLGMRERVALLGGTIEIDAAPGDGVVITAELPIDESDGIEAAT